VQVAARFGKMMFESRPQLRICGLFDHGRQSLQNPLFGVVDVPERMDEQIIHRFDIFGEEAHNFHLVDLKLI
jgi:hypothetical protein